MTETNKQRNGPCMKVHLSASHFKACTITAPTHPRQECKTCTWPRSGTNLQRDTLLWWCRWENARGAPLPGRKLALVWSQSYLPLPELPTSLPSYRSLNRRKPRCCLGTGYMEAFYLKEIEYTSAWLSLAGSEGTKYFLLIKLRWCFFPWLFFFLIQWYIISYLDG